MPISFTTNPTPNLSITANPQARFSATVALDWESIVNKPEIIDNLEDLTTELGLLTRTDTSDAIAARSLTAPAAGFTITHPAGIAGDPTFVLANDLAALEGLASTGIAVRTATDTWAQRTITGTANEITATNGNGVSGNPTLSLPSALTFTGKTITGGTYVSPTIDAGILLTDGGSSRVQLDLGSENVMAFSGVGNSKTTAIHLNPGSGTLPTGTICEVVIQRTADQAFAGNYGRWSLTALGSAQNNVSGIYGEFGGTVDATAFIFNLGVENPASTFTSYEYFRLDTAASGGDTGTTVFGNSQTPKDIIQLKSNQPSSAGVVNSHALLLTGWGYDTGVNSAKWRLRVIPSANDGTSSLAFVHQLNAGAQTNKVLILDTGQISAGSLALTTALTAPNGGTGQSSYAIGDLLYASTTTALSKLAAVATGRLLASAGTGTAPAWSASPSLTTSLTVPLVIGGTAVSSSLTLQSTSGNGSSDSILFKVGNNGATTAGTISTTGQWGIGSQVPDAKLNINDNTGVVTPAFASPIHVVGADASNAGATFDSFGAGTTVGFRRANNTLATKQATTGNVFAFAVYGHDGTNYSASARATFAADAAETFGASAQGTLWRFSTTPIGSTTIAEAMRIHPSGGVSIGTTTDAGLGMIRTNSASFMIRTSTSYTNGAGVGGGTLTNAPAAGNPTKWIPVDDNGTTRYVPAW
jgi:hypothetical protein